MGVIVKNIVLNQIEEIFNIYNELRLTFKPLGYLGIGMLGANQEEIAKTNGLITRAKALVSRCSGEESIYFTQIELHSQPVRNGKCGRNELHIVMEDLRVLYENLKNDYESLIQSFTTSLKFDKIIEIDLLDNTYEEVIKEINGTYIDHYFASMYIMVRKLLENLLYDCLKKYYDKDGEKYYNTVKGQHQGFGTLKDNFNIMIKETRFKTDVGDVEQQFIDLLKGFQEKGNKNAHSLFNLPHQEFIEDRKEKINIMIKKLDWATQKL
ncbi:MAG: hypothetical protein ACTSRI_09750 [Promethearchaeota archaeon]